MDFFINDLKHEIFSFLDWNIYYDICIVYQIPITISRLFSYYNPTINEITNIQNSVFNLLEVASYKLSINPNVNIDTVYIACKNGNLDLLKLLQSHLIYIPFFFYENLIDIALYDEHINIIEYAYPRIIRLEYKQELFRYACKYRKSEVIKFIHEKTQLRLEYNDPLRYDEELFNLFSSNDNKIIRWLQTCGYKNERCIIL